MTEYGIPKFAKVIIVGAAVLVVLVVAAAFKLQDVVRDRQQESCERTVAARVDSRTMWVYALAGDEVDQDDPRVIAFERELDRRLPVLECVNRQPVPIEADEG